MTLTILSYPVVWPHVSKMATVGLIAVAFQVGTGGIQDADYYKHRGIMGYPYVSISSSDTNADSKTFENIRTPAENLTHIKKILKPSITDLATTLGVSRQAIYDWQGGKAITAENAARLADLGRAADILEAHELNNSVQLLRRPIKSGKTLLEIFRDGGSAESAALELANRIGRELQQRKVLATKLAGRKRVETPEEDHSAPVMNELS